MVIIELQRTHSLYLLLANFVYAKSYNLLLMLSASVLLALAHYKFYYCNRITQSRNLFISHISYVNTFKSTMRNIMISSKF